MMKTEKVVSITKEEPQEQYVYDVGMGGNFPFNLYPMTHKEIENRLVYKMQFDDIVLNDGTLELRLKAYKRVAVKDSFGVVKIVFAAELNDSMEILDWEL